MSCCGFGSSPVDDGDGGGSLVCGAGVPAVEGLSEEGPAGSALEAAGSSSEQPPQALGVFGSSLITIIRERYWDFGPTPRWRRSWANATGITVCRETWRKWMIADVLWSRSQAAFEAGSSSSACSPRVRWRAGEIDGASIVVRGIEGRNARSWSLSMMHSRLMHLQFLPRSIRPSRMSRRPPPDLEAWGKPVAFYSDNHGVFRGKPAGRARR